MMKKIIKISLAVTVFAVYLFMVIFYDHFSIPSLSMSPTLKQGDRIIAKAYAIKIPYINYKILDLSEPKRGDIAVFRYPKDTSVLFVKRIIGMPNDKVKFSNGYLYINDKQLKKTRNTTLPHESYADIFNEVIDKRTYTIKEIQGVSTNAQAPFLQQTNSNVLPMNLVNNWEVSVPKDYYFMMGDSRDESADSRFWGFVHKKDINSKVQFVYMNQKNFYELPDFARNGVVQ